MQTISRFYVIKVVEFGCLNVYITHEHKLSYTHTGYYERLTFGGTSEFKIMSFEIFLKHMFLQYITKLFQ